VNVHDSVELPEPVTLVGDMVHDVLLVVMVMVDVAAVPGV